MCLTVDADLRSIAFQAKCNLAIDEQKYTTVLSLFVMRVRHAILNGVTFILSKGQITPNPHPRPC